MWKCLFLVKALFTDTFVAQHLLDADIKGKFEGYLFKLVDQYIEGISQRCEV